MPPCYYLIAQTRPSVAPLASGKLIPRRSLDLDHGSVSCSARPGASKAGSGAAMNIHDLTIVLGAYGGCSAERPHARVWRPVSSLTQ